MTSALIEIFTDGACRGNPGPGGWAALMRSGAHENMFSGAEAATTNNRMEVMAAIEALRALKQPSRIRLTTDSQYLRQGVTSWVKNGRRTDGGRLPTTGEESGFVGVSRSSRRSHQIEWCWVKGHSGHVENELVDAAANQAIDRLLQDDPQSE